MDLFESDGVPIKYEPEPEPVPQSPTSSLKRRRSEDDSSQGEKRQRVESISAEPGADDDMGVFFAQAAAAAAQEIEEHINSASQIDTAASRSDHSEPIEHSNGFTSDPYLFTRILSLPMLESLSVQILATLAQGPYAETISIIQKPRSELGQAYATLKSLFDQTKMIYSRRLAFLSADELNIKEPNHRATIRTTNLATFVTSVFSGQDVGFYELDDNFIGIFTPDNEPLEEKPGQLYINLKTQMYLSAVLQEEQEKTKEDLLDNFFPTNLEEVLSNRHPGVPLAQSEIDFLNAAKQRREFLMSETNDDVESIQRLSETYDWEDFLRNLSAYLNAAHEPLIAPYLKRHDLTAPTPLPRFYNNTYDQQTRQEDPPKPNEDDIFAQAELAAQEALRSVYGQNHFEISSSESGVPQQQQQQSEQQAQQQQHEQHEQHEHQGYQAQAQNSSYQMQYTAEVAPYPTQTAPTQVLYERARQAAVAKANPGNNRRPGLPSQRRPWSTEEEHALMAGLDQVKGPHWSQILALYGPEGTVNHILKDRNQVQLKDKARNLKLFFLKSNIEVPYYLQCVTGELKTRAPSQAARKEAEERARLAGDDEQARFNGIMALASGMQDQGQTNGHHHAILIQAPEGPIHSRDNTSSPEQLHVVEPEHQNEPSITPPLSEEESLRQQLMAATADSLQSIGVHATGASF